MAQNLVQSFIERNNSGNSNFGISVSGAGDLNNDGYSDVIIGACNYLYSTGRCYIYFGGSSMDNVADLIITGQAPYNYFGNSASGAGDVNNDGYSDVIIGALGYKSDMGRVYIYYGGNKMDTIPDLTMTGEKMNNYFGASVAEAGDVNSDGYPDVIVGASAYASDTGRVYIYYGGNLMDNMADVILTCGENKSKYGCSVDCAGDVNGDGYDDVIVGAYEYNYPSEFGRAYIYYGGSSMNDTADVIMTGDNRNNRFGMYVAGIGDVNKDGYSDVAVSAIGYTAEQDHVDIYFGNSNMDNVEDLTMKGDSQIALGESISGACDINGDTFPDVIIGAYNHYSDTGFVYIYFGSINMDNVADIIIRGESDGGYNLFGYSSSGIGDVNGDGYDDIIVGPYRFDSETGRAYVYYGGSSIDSSPDLLMIGETAYNSFGVSVSDAGDVNGDGFADVIIGAEGYDSGMGRAYIYYGGSTMNATADVILTNQTTNDFFGLAVSSAGDLNNDGYDDVIVGAKGYDTDPGSAFIYFGGSYMDSIADVTIIGEEDGDCFGYSVSGAGDVNNDGFDDVIISAFGYDSYTGRAYIFFGGNGMDNTADVVMTGEKDINTFGASVSGAGDVNNDGYADVIVGASDYNRAYIYFGGNSMDSIADVTIAGEDDGDSFGYSVSCAGDVNNDGYDDIIVGAYCNNSNTGRAYIYYGGINMDNKADITLTGEATDDCFGYSVSGAGDVNKDGYSDVIIGASDYNSYTGRTYIYFGGSSMDNIADITITGEGSDNFFGNSVSNAGDVNGDGFCEVLIGADSYPTNGKAYLYNFKPVVQENLTLNDSILDFGDIQCYNALQNIIVSEIPSVILHDGASVTFIAGNSIRFLPGFYAESGSVMNAYITTDATFCDMVVPKSITGISIAEDAKEKPSFKKESQQIKLYPNPNTGSFTLELTNFEAQATVAIYNLLGEKIAQYYRLTGILQPINLEGIRKGIYFVEVSDGKTKMMKKMIVN
jgi:hypothetical protein